MATHGAQSIVMAKTSIALLALLLMRTSFA